MGDLNYYERWRKSESVALLMSTEGLLKFFCNPCSNLRKLGQATENHLVN